MACCMGCIIKNQYNLQMDMALKKGQIFLTVLNSSVDAPGLIDRRSQIYPRHPLLSAKFSAKNSPDPRENQLALGVHSLATGEILVPCNEVTGEWASQTNNPFITEELDMNRFRSHMEGLTKVTTPIATKSRQQGQDLINFISGPGFLCCSCCYMGELQQRS
eukprot:gene15830-4780_t